MTPIVLFLCTGNYYRSRFAEEWFNHCARALAHHWRAESAGLAERCWTQNLGNISSHTARELRALQVSVLGAERRPRDVDADLLRAASRVVALYRSEHEPMVQRRFPELASRIEYWDVPDVDELEPRLCLPRIRSQVEHLLTQLS